MTCQKWDKMWNQKWYLFPRIHNFSTWEPPELPGDCASDQGFPKPLRFCIFSPSDTFHLISSKCVFCGLYVSNYTKYQPDLF